MAKENPSAVQPGKPMIGLNYPIAWNAYGVYFGGGNPPGSNAQIDQWTTNLANNLFTLRDQFNIRVVRIFLLCNAANYGGFNRSGFQPPPTLHPKFLEHLKLMLEAFAQAQSLVIPSLIDFKAFGRRVVFKSRQEKEEEFAATGKVPPGDLVDDTNGCTNRRAIAADQIPRDFFMKQVLEQFLVASKPLKDVIYAWEVMNEPVWNTRGFPTPDHVAGGRTLDEAQVSTFLQQALDLIKKHEFPSTVGHRFADDLKTFPTGTQRQFHFYPANPTLPGTNIPSPITLADRSLPEYKQTNAFLGEIGCIGRDSRGRFPHGGPWLELNGADENDTRSRVLERLKLVRKKGYPLVLLWPDGPEPGVPLPDPIKLTPGARQGVLDFNKL